MKMKPLFAALCLAVTAGFAADQPAPPATPPAPKTPEAIAFSELMATARDKNVEREKVVELTLTYVRNFPEAQNHLGNAAGLLVKVVQFAEPEKREEKLAHVTRRVTETLASPDLADPARDMLMTINVMLALRQFGSAVEMPPDMGLARANLDAFFSRYPQSNNWAYCETEYAKRLGKTDPAAEVAHLQKVAAAANPQMAEYIRGLLLVKAAGSAPMELKFTSADGREVDLSKLRGKVVLIDFWATWCGPCIAELPNVKKVYAAYHDKGFEVVGIALENGKLLPKDTSEQVAAKLEAAKKILTDFTAKEAMPWPQYFDGKYWKNDISSKYSINAIPAMFLLSQDGKVVSTNARGEALEREVQRLLKL